MPLIVQDFKWHQSNTVIIIHVPLHGIHQSKVDIVTSSKYIKASYEQFFFEVFLLHAINKLGSRCTLTSTEIIFELLKCEEIEWTSLESKISKLEKLELKKHLIKEEYETFQDNSKIKQNKKAELKRIAVREQINLDSKQREVIEHIKVEEKTTALGDFKKWHSNRIEISSDYETKPTLHANQMQLKKINSKSKIQCIPLPREVGTLEVEFTPRQFPTPSRESYLEEETEWLKKQAEVRRSVGFMSEDLRAEEKNPQYLKSKGDEFFKTGNYLAAISAYSFGITLSIKFVDLYVGRAEAHFKQGNFYKCITDCTTAIDIMKPVVPSNITLRNRCVAQRGIALYKLGFKHEGLSELESAIKFEPYNKNFQTMLNECINIE